jgi:hypothetical protein
MSCGQANASLLRPSTLKMICGEGTGGSLLRLASKMTRDVHVDEECTVGENQRLELHRGIEVMLYNTDSKILGHRRRKPVLLPAYRICLQGIAAVFSAPAPTQMR